MIEKGLCPSWPAMHRRCWLAAMAVWPWCAVRAQAGPAQLLRVGVLKDYLPFSVVDAQGRLSGFDVDVTSHLATLMHLRVEFVPDTLKGLTQRLAQGDIQWIGNQLLATPENRRLFDLVQPAYASIQLSVIQHENDSRDFLSLEDLFGQRLGVLALTGTAQQAKGVLGHTVRPYLRIEDALEDLVQGKLDAVLEENLIVDYYIEKMNWPLKVAAPFAAPMKVGLAVRKGDQARNSQLSWAVRLMLKDGSLSPIAHRWFGYDVSRFRVGHSL